MTHLFLETTCSLLLLRVINWKLTNLLISLPIQATSSKTHKQSLKVLNINCQSIVNKKAEFQAIIDSHNPDIIVGTESWLNKTHLSSEIFPSSLGYTPFRQDREADTCGGGVFILVKNTLIATEQKQLMHQSFATTSPSGPGNSGDIDFSFQSPGICPALQGYSYGQSSAKVPAQIPAGKCKFSWPFWDRNQNPCYSTALRGQC